MRILKLKFKFVQQALSLKTKRPPPGERSLHVPYDTRPRIISDAVQKNPTTILTAFRSPFTAAGRT